MSNSTGKAIDFKLLGRTLRYAKPYKWIFIFTIFATIITAFLAPVRTILVERALDKYIQVGDIEGLNLLLLVLLAILIFHAGMQFVQSYSANWLGQRIILDLRRELFRYVLSFKMKYFDRNPIGNLVTRVTSDIQTITEIFSQGLIVIIADILQLVIALVFMFYTNSTLAWIVMAPIPVLILCTIIFKNIIKKAFQKVRLNVAKINTFIQEHVTGMNVVQIFNREKEEMRRFEEVNRAHRDGWLMTVWANAVFFPVVEILSACSLGLLIWWGAKGVLQEVATIGDIVAFILFVHMLFRPIRQLADRFNTLQMGIVASERVFKILDTDAHIADNGELKPESIEGRIRFDKVHFEYTEGVEVLKGISFDLQPGRTLALVGATGAGKTSIINVLTRFYQIKSGSVTIDDYDLKSIDLSYLRQMCAVVLQDVFLFNDTIMNNVTLGNKSVTKEDVIRCAKEIGAHGFIEKLPVGYDYHVRERGVMLSVGQRQLLAFLRAYLYNPSILILDEATSSVDTQSEILIQRAIDKITENRTSIVIAHRLSTIQNADEIIVLDKGNIVEHGNHEELIQKEGYYKRLYDYQFAS